MFNYQDNDFKDNNLTKIDSITVNEHLASDNEVPNKKIVNDSIEKRTVLRFSQTRQNYLKISVGNYTYNLNKKDKLQITDKIFIKYPNTGGDLQRNWVIKCNDKKTNGKMQNFIKSAKTKNPTGYSAAETLPPIGNNLMYIKTSSKNHGNIVFVGFERTDNIQVSNILFYYNTLSILSKASLKSMDCFRLQLLLKDNTWSTSYYLTKIDR